MNTVHSGRRWLRGGIALGATLVALGAVLTAPAAHAAGPPTVRVAQCGPASWPRPGLTVQASGFPATDVYVTITRPNGDNIAYRSTGTDNNGNLNEAIPVQFGDAPAGLVTVSTFGSNPIKASAWFFVGCAAFGVSPRLTVRHGGTQPLGVTLSGFQPGMPVELTVPGVLDRKPLNVGNGSLNTTVALPSQPACGFTTVTARQRSYDSAPPSPEIAFAPAAAFDSSRLDSTPRLAPGPSRAPAALAANPVPAPDRVRTTSVYVLCPSFSASPTTFADTALPGPTNATGTGWTPNLPVRLTLDGATVGTITPDRSGAWSGPVRLPRRGCGAHALEAVQNYGIGDSEISGIPEPPAPMTLRARTTVTVTCALASLAVNPAVVPQGKTTEAAGAGFVPGRTVTLTWIAPDGKPFGDAATVQVAAGGTFLVTCLVMPKSDLGTRQLRAVETVAAGDPVAARAGVADVLVVPGSMQPGRTAFLVRQ